MGGKITTETESERVKNGIAYLPKKGLHFPEELRILKKKIRLYSVFTSLKDDE